jgi:RNA polymerase sigma-70 factor, ECF subfamily
MSPARHQQGTRDRACRCDRSPGGSAGFACSPHRKRVREVEDADGSYAARLRTCPEQHGHLDFEDLRRALQCIPADQREALLLIAAEGLSYEEAALITGVAEGTVKSRVNRARRRLAKLLSVEPVEEVGPDSVVRSVLDAVR